MNSICQDFVTYILTGAPQHQKKKLQDAVCARYGLTRDRAVFRNQYFAVRFCQSQSSSDSFSNTVLSLSALEKYDHIPFFVVLVRQEADNIILLANTTLLSKISHSSSRLKVNNIVGSFNGSDIMRSLDGVDNTPENFSELFATHQGQDWSDNLERLVEATAAIAPTAQKFQPDDRALSGIMGSVDRASHFVSSANFKELENDLTARCRRCRNEIAVASHIENVNIRGRLIEALITASDRERASIMSELADAEGLLPVYSTRNGLGDYHVRFDNGDTYTDIKTKIVWLHSNPKAFNIDKFLARMSDTSSVMLFFFVGIDSRGVFATRLCSVFHDTLVTNSLFQTHWSGRSTRGTVQYRGDAIDAILRDKSFQNHIDAKLAADYLQSMLDR